MLSPHDVFGMSGLAERARAEAAKAPEFTPGSRQWTTLAAIIAAIPDVPAKLAVAA